MPIYAVGDIHGAQSQLDRALRLIEADGGPQARVVFLGDYVDRGPDSRGVLDRLIAGRRAGKNWVCLKGNHDHMFQRFLEAGAVADGNIASGRTWLHPALGGAETLASYPEVAMFTHPANGGRATLASYGVDPAHDAELSGLARAARQAVPEAHLALLRSLPLMHVTDDQVFVHAGIRPGVALADQMEDDLIWIREGFLEETADFGRLVVHGHTALTAPEHYGNRLNLDSGAGYGRPLSAARIEGRHVHVLNEDGPVPLTPRRQG